MSHPLGSLRTLIDEPFCYDNLARVDSAVSDLAVATPAERVACYVISQVCRDLCRRMEGVAITTANHAAIEAHVDPAMKLVLSALNEGKTPSIEALDVLIAESKHVRTRMVIA